MTNINDIDSLLKKMDVLDVQATSLRNQREALNNELRKWLGRRDSLNLMRRKIWKEISLYKDKRDEINQAVKKLKKDQVNVISQINAGNKQYVDLTKRLNVLLSKTVQNGDDVNRQIKDLDWEIQTNPLTPVEEAEIIDQIRRLEKQLLIHREALNLKNKKSELFSEIEDLKIRRNAIHNEKADYVNKSREYHNKMLERIKEANRLKVEADLAHKKFVEFREAANDIHNKYLEVTTQIKSISLKIREIEESTHRKNLDKMIQVRSKEAYEKLKERKKLTLDEYKILRRKGLV